MPTTGKASLYFHVPFCTRKCPYCHFYVVPDKADLKDLLLESLRLEWEREKEKLQGKTIASVYFGGGTPSLFGPKALAEILSWLGNPSCEITLEANPEQITLPLMQQFAAAGINRVSIGIQSLHDPTLQKLGRTHDAQKGIQAIHDTAQASISNITIDLMYEVPGQTIDSWNQTLGQLATLPITHLSLYNLTFEPQTVFFKKKEALKPLLPPPEASLEMLETAVFSLQQLGLKRYEISAFAQPGFESCHNLGYWTGRPFLGLGPSAFSFWEGKRYRNISDLKKYATALQSGLSPVDFEETLPYPANLHELCAVRLRLLEGVDTREYPIAPALFQQLQERGWLSLEGPRARLTAQGLLFYDSVASEIIL
jgi:oxygen-independent coproporphyrinogen-3 oxidase